MNARVLKVRASLLLLLPPASPSIPADIGLFGRETRPAAAAIFVPVKRKNANFCQFGL